MALKLNKLFTKELVNFNKFVIRYKSQRRTLGKSPEIARSLAQRLEELNYKDPSVYYTVNIGFALKRPPRKEITTKHIELLRKNRSNSELEQISRDNKLIIPLEEVHEEWLRTDAPHHIKTIAEHYSIFEHLFGDAYFYPVVNMKVLFDDGDYYVPVCTGNSIKPSQTHSSPDVSFKSNPDSLWTLVLTTPDGHFTSEKLEYVHWMVGNIQGNDVKKGEVIYDYFQPLPPKGLGHLRYVLVLYKQDKKIDFSDIKTDSFSGDLNERSFCTYEFYKKHQDYMTPAGLSFFTSDWDRSVTEFYHKKLKTECPEFVYDFPDHFYKKQEWFPIRQPFNLYLDRYRDEKEIAKEFLVKKLKDLDPFKDKSDQKLKFPNAIPFKPGTPSWLKNEMRKQRLGLGRAKDYE